MSSIQSHAGSMSSPFNDFVASDFMALASHMDTCHQAGGKLSHVHVLLDRLYGLAAPRIVTSTALLAVCAIALTMLA